MAVTGFHLNARATVPPTRCHRALHRPTHHHTLTFLNHELDERQPNVAHALQRNALALQRASLLVRQGTLRRPTQRVSGNVSSKQIWL